MGEVCQPHHRRQRPAAVAVVLLTLSLPACASHSLARRPHTVETAPLPPARPAATSVVLESWDPALSAALAALALSPTGPAHRQVAIEYRRLGVLDKAHAYFSKAVDLDPNDAAAYDALARIWRDWGFPEQGLPDARRAVELAPQSPAAVNTLGTLLEAMGRLNDARGSYERAVS